jgi:hypothetical protein
MEERTELQPKGMKAFNKIIAENFPNLEEEMTVWV